MHLVHFSENASAIFEQFGGTWTFRIEPPRYRAGRLVTLCVVCHGAGGYVREREADWLRPNAGGRATVERLVEHGFLVAMSDAAGDNWGNAAGQAECIALIDGLRERYDLAPQIVLVGRSMGGALALNLVLGRLAGQVSRLALLQPVVDLTYRLQTNPSDTLRAAFGGVPDAAWPETVARFCPLTQLRLRPMQGPAAPPLPPTKVWQNCSDTTCRITLTEELVALWRQAGGSIDLAALDGGGHTVYGQEPVATAVAEFLRASL